MGGVAVTELRELPADGAGFVPAAEDVESVLAWFAQYDTYVAEGNIEGMAGMAMFPINEVSDRSDGNASVTSCDRDRFVDQMTEIVGGAGDVRMESTRTPHFLNQNLVFVITDATITANGQTQQVRYGDLLVKADGRWVFQTMVQGGWGDR
jgi:hypothetical protein